MIPEKPIEYWLVIAALAVWLVTKKVQGISLWKHYANSLISALLTIGLSPALAERVYGGEIGAAIMCMAIGVPLLNTLAAVAEDKKFMRGVVERLFGKGGDPDA